MAHTIETATKEVAITNGSFGHPVNNAIDRMGYWYMYLPADVNNASYLADIKPYNWSTALPLLNAASSMEMEGTIALITEPWDGSNVKYHGGVIEHIGAGVNDITNAQEDNAFFFSHLGSLSPSTNDDAFYWDRAFLPTGGSDWEYYQYHKHLPTSYPRYENGRMTVSGGNFIRPTDKAFGYMIHIRVSVSGVAYQSILARIHTPSVGGAHNSHNDVTLPTIANKNYQMGGLIKGSGDRFHAFYIAPEGSDWRLYTRTYVDTSTSFTTQTDLGLYNFADATLSPSDSEASGNCYNYPVRASAGDLLGTRIYFPVIMNNVVSGFDLEVWSFTSADTLGTGSLTRTVLVSGAAVRPDCQILAVGTHLYAVTTDVSGGGVKLFVNPGTGWEAATNSILTNAAANRIRIHGLRYSVETAKFFVLLSGTSSGTGTYTGPGLYSFNLLGDFGGYKHLDYDASTNSFISRNALTAGYLLFNQADATLKRINSTEPEGIATGTNVLDYGAVEPVFFNRTELNLGASEFIYQGIKLADNRKMLVGRVEGLDYGTGTSDLLVSIINQDNVTGYHFAWGGDTPTNTVNTQGDDYVTGVYQSPSDPNKVWITGYTKTELVSKRDMWIHGFCRSMTDAPNVLQHNDLAIDSQGSVYLVGTNNSEYATVVKYDANYDLQWQKQLGFDTTVTGSSITVDDSNNVYVVGTVDGTDAMVAKMSSTGSLIWVKSFGTALGTEAGTGIAFVTSGLSKYIAVSVISGTSTTFLILDLNGDIVEQSSASNLVVNRLRKHQSTTDGKFLFAGTDGSTNGKFGMCQIDSETRMVQWVNTFATTATDIQNVDAGPTFGYVVCGKTGTSASLLKVTVTESVGVYTVSKSWARTLTNSEFNAIAVSAHTDAVKSIYAVGKTTAGGYAAMGMDEGVIVKYNSSGTLQWQNVFGHDMDESLTGAVFDVTGNNIVTSGWSESHSNARDAFVFRCETGGYGTGVYHINGNTGVPYYYVKTSLTDASDASSVTSLTAPGNTPGTLVNGAQAITLTDGGAEDRIFDGSYGANGVFMAFIGYVDLKKVQEYLNSDEYKANQALGRKVNYTKEIFTFWQGSTVGDGSADDGNVFCYDVIESSDGLVYVIGQTSGDLSKTNTGDSGVYDYFLLKLNPATNSLRVFQNGSALDEETYALTELSDGTIAFTGRTTGDLGGLVNLGGYDIFLGIYNPTNDTFSYYSTGTGLDDRGINIHDLGNNELAIVYSSYGGVGNQTSLGPEDVGVIKFNYSTDTWGSAYQTGTTSADLFEQNGKPSTKLNDGRIAIVFSTNGSYDEVNVSAGFLDIALAIVDPSTGVYTKASIGSQSSDIATSVFSRGERLLITGFITNTFEGTSQAVYVESDIQFGVNGKSSS